MKNMVNKKYYKPNITDEWIRKSPFRYSFSDSDESAYVYRFPVYKNGSIITLEGEIILFNKSGNVALNVFKYGTREKYTSFYCSEYGSNKVLDVLHKNIQKEFYKLGIIQKEDK